MCRGRNPRACEPARRAASPVGYLAQPPVAANQTPTPVGPVRCPSLRNPHGGPVRPARAGPGNDCIAASIASADRTHMTGWGNVARAAISAVLPTF